MAPVYIQNSAVFLPNEPVGNDAIEQVLGLQSKRSSKIKSVVLRANGIKTRYYAIDPRTRRPTHTNAQLVKEAVARLLADAKIDPPSIDLLCCGTTSPDQLTPSHASMVHGEIGNLACEIVSTSGVCCSSMSALKYGYLSLKCGDKNCAVVTGSEISSKVMRAENFTSDDEVPAPGSGPAGKFCFQQAFLRWMLSDGAGALLLGTQPVRGALSLRIDWIEVLSFAQDYSACMYAGALKGDDGRLTSWLDFDRREMFEKQVMNLSQDVDLLDAQIMPVTVERGLSTLKKKYGLRPGDFHWFVPHYSSDYFRPKLAASLDNIDFSIPYDKWYTRLADLGNIGAASMFVYLHELLRSGSLEKGQTILCYVPESARFSVSYMQLTVVGD